MGDKILTETEALMLTIPKKTEERLIKEKHGRRRQRKWMKNRNLYNLVFKKELEENRAKVRDQLASIRKE